MTPSANVVPSVQVDTAVLETLLLFRSLLPRAGLACEMLIDRLLGKGWKFHIHQVIVLRGHSSSGLLKSGVSGRILKLGKLRLFRFESKMWPKEGFLSSTPILALSFLFPRTPLILISATSGPKS